MRLSAGQSLDGRFIILEPLGSGGFGAVYKASQLNLDRQVAIKIIEMDVSADDDSWQRMQREALVLSNLNHRNIVSFYGFGLFGNTPYMVIEYVTGKTLHKLFLQATQLSIGRIINYGMQICEALSHAHHNGIIHRDLKPGNIMISESETAPLRELVRVIDFGLAKLLPDFGKDLQKLTQTGATVGSVLYMSPEQCMGSVDTRSDVYSVGAILYHCVSGHPPFLAPHDFSVMRAHIMDRPEPLTMRANDDPRQFAELQKVIFKALAKHPDDRYQNADEMLADLQSVNAGDNVTLTTDRPQLAAPQAKQGMRKLSGLAISATTTAFLIAATLSLALVATFSFWHTIEKNKTAESLSLDSVRGASYLYRQWRQQLSDLGDEEEAKKNPASKKVAMFKEMVALNLRDHSLDSDSNAVKDVLRRLAESYFELEDLQQGWAVYNSQQSRIYLQRELPDRDVVLESAGWSAARVLTREHITAADLAVAMAVRNTICRRVVGALDASKPAYKTEPFVVYTQFNILAGLDHQLPGDAQSRLDNDRVILTKFSRNQFEDLPQSWLTLANCYFSPRLKDKADAISCWERASALIDSSPEKSRQSTIDTLGYVFSTYSCWQREIDLCAHVGCHDFIQWLALALAYQNVGREADSMAILERLWQLKPDSRDTKDETYRLLNRYYRLLLIQGKTARAQDFRAQAERVTHYPKLFVVVHKKAKH